MERFSGGFLISVSLTATDPECLIRNLIFNLLKFTSASFGDSHDLEESPGSELRAAGECGREV